MKKYITILRDTLIAGLFFLFPLLVLLVVMIKVFHVFNAVTSKIAEGLGLHGLLGASASTVVGIISLLLLCLLCGYLIRIAFFRQFSEWVDKKLKGLIPGYELYQSRIQSKLEADKNRETPEVAAWVDMGEGLQPGFIMETMPDGKIIVYLPTAGNIDEGTILAVDASKVTACPGYNKWAFRLAINNLGLGFSKLDTEKK